MQDKIKMFIDNEEVVSNNDFTINQEILSPSSTILNNCYPESWETTKDYVSNFYYPKDYSRFVLGKGQYEYGNTEFSVLNITGGANIQYETNVEKNWNNVEVLGNSYQAITSQQTGKNLLCLGSVSGSLGLTINKNNNGTITINGTANANGTVSIPLINSTTLSSTTYTLSFRCISGTASNTFTIGIPQATGGFQNISLPSNFTSRTSSVEAGRTYTAINLTINNLTAFNNLVIQMQLEVGSSATAFEPYYSIPASPTPDNPSEIQNVGYQNLLNLYISGSSSSSGIDYTVNSDKSITLNGTATSTFYLSLNLQSGYYGHFKNGNIYTSCLKGCQDKVRMVTRYVESASVFLSTSFNEEYNTQTYTGVTDKDCFTYITIASGTKVENLTVYPMITEGNTIYSYIPYGKYGIEIKNNGKNLFNNNLIQIGKAWNNASNTARAIVIMPVKPSTNYTISFNSISNLEAVYAFGRQNQNDSTRTMGNVNYDITGTRTLTTDGNTHYLGIQCNKTNITKQDITNCLFQVEEGSTGTEYEEYKSNTQLYVLDEPLRAIGNVKDKLYVENGKLYVEKNIRHFSLAVADMNNGEDFPGWTNIPETTQLKADYPNKNITFASANIKYLSNIRVENFSADYFALNTNNYGVLFLIKGMNNNLTQTQWKSTYPDLIITFDYEMPESEILEIGNVELPTAYNGTNNVVFNTMLNTTETIYYYWKNYDVLFSGVVKNSGEISLRPQDPKYCSLQILDYKTFLSECDTLDFVISEKTISEAIQMVVDRIIPYGFILGNINISQANDIIGAYSTLNQSPYDVLQYLANISGSRWRARVVDSYTMAIDFYDPDLLPQANNIEYNKQYFEDNNIINLTFNYGTRDYRNKQIVLSNEVYGDIDYTQNIYTDGYTQEFLLEENIGNVKSLYLNGVSQDVITKEEKDNGVDGDFYYTPGKNTINSVKLLSVNNELVVNYTPLIAGRQIVYNSDEVNRIKNQTGTIGIISRYETRNDILSNIELNQVAQTYINFKGTAEILLNIQTKDNDMFDIGEVAYFEAPIDELKQFYMVKTKNINYVVINGTPTLFYEYQLTSSYNNEKAINYFDNQRNKAQGNIQIGQTITRNIDIENEATIIWQNSSISEVEIEVNNDNVLNNSFNSPFID